MSLQYSGSVISLLAKVICWKRTVCPGDLRLSNILKLSSFKLLVHDGSILQDGRVFIHCAMPKSHGAYTRT